MIKEGAGGKNFLPCRKTGNPAECGMTARNRGFLESGVSPASSGTCRDLFDTLMGKDVMPRKKFIQVHARKVRNLDI